MALEQVLSKLYIAKRGERDEVVSVIDSVIENVEEELMSIEKKSAEFKLTEQGYFVGGELCDDTRQKVWEHIQTALKPFKDDALNGKWNKKFGKITDVVFILARDSPSITVRYTVEGKSQPSDLPRDDNLQKRMISYIYAADAEGQMKNILLPCVKQIMKQLGPDRLRELIEINGNPSHVLIGKVAWNITSYGSFYFSDDTLKCSAPYCL